MAKANRPFNASTANVLIPSNLRRRPGGCRASYDGLNSSKAPGILTARPRGPNQRAILCRSVALLAGLRFPAHCHHNRSVVDAHDVFAASKSEQKVLGFVEIINSTPCKNIALLRYRRGPGRPSNSDVFAEFPCDAATISKLSSRNMGLSRALTLPFGA